LLPTICGVRIVVSETQRRYHHRLDGVHAVLGLVEDDGRRRLKHVFGHFQPIQAELLVDPFADLRLAVVEGGQAVHELHRRVAAAGHGRRVDLIGLQQVNALLPDGVRLAHRHPHVGVDVVHAPEALVHVLGQRQPRACLFSHGAGGGDQIVIGPQAPRGADAHVHAQLAAADQQRVAHVKAGVAHIAVGNLIGRLRRVLDHRQHVGQNLRRVKLIGQPVPDGHTGIAGQRLDRLLGKATVLDAVVHTPQYARRVLHRLLVADLRPLRAEVSHVRPLVIGSHLEGAARARAGLLEDESDVLAHQARPFVAAVLGRFQVGVTTSARSVARRA
jgi:hypothetical protein